MVRILACFALLSTVAAALVPPAAAAQAERSLRAEVFFRLANPCPSTGEALGECAGYVIDRIIPWVCGGAEEPANMQWQTLAEAKEKDQWESIGCRAGRKQVISDGPSITEAHPVEELPPVTEISPLPIEGTDVSEQKFSRPLARERRPMRTLPSHR